MKVRWILVLSAAAWGCEPRVDAPRAISDSLVPRDAAIAQFRSGSDSLDTLTAGAGSRDELMRRFGLALAARDTATIRHLLLSRREFGWLFYPYSAQSRPPYELPPELLWDQLSRQSSAGMTYLFRHIGGPGFQYYGYECAPTPAVEAQNQIWGPCTITFRTPAGDSGSARLTGPVLERGGRFAFISFTNDLD